MTPEQKLKAEVFRVVEEVETRTQARVAAGASLQEALMLTVMEMGGRIVVVKDEQ